MEFSYSSESRLLHCYYIHLNHLWNCEQDLRNLQSRIDLFYFLIGTMWLCEALHALFLWLHSWLRRRLSIAKCNRVASNDAAKKLESGWEFTYYYLLDVVVTTRRSDLWYGFTILRWGIPINPTRLESEYLATGNICLTKTAIAKDFDSTNLVKTMSLQIVKFSVKSHQLEGWTRKLDAWNTFYLSNNSFWFDLRLKNRFCASKMRISRKNRKMLV